MKTNVCESISRFPLSSAHACIVLPSSHPLSPNASVSLKGLENETFILYPKTREECIRSFQLKNLKASGIDFSVYDSETSPSFFHLLVSSGKGILLTPFHATKEIPGCAVIPVTNIPCPAPVTLFYKRSNTKPEIHHFITGFSKFIRETSSNEHRKTL